MKEKTTVIPQGTLRHKMKVLREVLEGSSHSPVRQFSPEECKAYEQELKERDAKRPPRSTSLPKRKKIFTWNYKHGKKEP